MIDALLDTILKIPQQPPFSEIPIVLKWVFDVGILFGFGFVIIAFVISGIYFIISPASVEWRGKAKEWFSGALAGLLIFTLFYLIITTLNPDLAFFRIGKPLQMPEEGKTSPAVTNPGLYFYEKTNCEGNALGYLDNPADIFRQSNKKIYSVKLVSNSLYNVFQDHYFAVIYGENYFQGKCQVYFTPNCYNVKINQINSIMVKKFQTLGGFGDLTFYRYPFFNENGGYLKLSFAPLLSASWANGSYLKTLTFTGNSGGNECSVPPKERDCTKQDNQGVCIQQQCPNLEGKNVASIKSNGSFISILSYKDLQDGSDIDTFCQTYPGVDDVNETGPKQITWDAINNNIGYKSFPNNQGGFPIHYSPNYLRVIFTKD